MASLQIPNRYLAAAAPVIVTAPTTRCGTTLVQRLLSDSDNAFLYGEEVGHQLKQLTTWFIGLLQAFEKDADALDADFVRAMAGELTDWRPSLMPPTQLMMNAWVETYYQLPTRLAEFGASIGRPVWGFKGPAYPRDMLLAFLALMPHARVIYVYRNPYEALKSAKARRFAEGEAGVAGFCAEWARNMDEVLGLGDDPRLLLLKYEDLVADPAVQIGRLEAFTGATGVKATALDLKINTFKGETDKGLSPTQYIAPAELSPGERAIVEAHAGALVARLYGRTD
jgi:hypothetical protein